MRNQRQLVSIGFPVFNGQDFVEKALQSLLDQSYKNFELVISDNASSDETSSICHRFAKKDKRIQYIRQKKNIGGIDNFNFVLKKAKGEYFMWACHDDQWDKDYIRKLLKLLESDKSADFAFSNYLFFNESKSLTTSLFLKNLFPVRTRYVLNYIDQYVLMHDTIHYALFKKDFLLRNGSFFTDSLRKKLNNRNIDILSTFKLVLAGKYLIHKEALFYKRDSKGYLDIFDNIQKHKLSFRYIKRIGFFALREPFLYLLDFYYFILFCLKTKQFNSYEKTVIILYLVKDLFKKEIIYSFLILKGMLRYIVGFFKKT